MKIFFVVTRFQCSVSVCGQHNVICLLSSIDEKESSSPKMENEFYKKRTQKIKSIYAT